MCSMGLWKTRFAIGTKASGLSLAKPKRFGQHDQPTTLHTLDADAPLRAAAAQRFLCSRDPAASDAVAWREGADALPASDARTEDRDRESRRTTARRDENAPPRWPASPSRDELPAPVRSCPPSSARRKSSGGSEPALLDRSSQLTCEKMCAEKDRRSGQPGHRPHNAVHYGTVRVAGHTTARAPASCPLFHPPLVA